ncbi:hypothetical protein [Microbacterium sp.]|uniref:hypothetical protein n=1 Tax=Microbacterium sp. TaxID=51671 RepID=UPI003A8D8B46
MTKATSWATSALVALLLILFLMWISTFRFAMPPVEPAPPDPNYSVQAAIAIAGCIAVIVGLVWTGISATRSERRRLRTTLIGCLLMIGVGMVTAVLAFTLS